MLTNQNKKPEAATEETKTVQEEVGQTPVSIQSQTNPLIEAVKGNNQPEFDRLLALIKPGTIDEEVDDKGNTALYWAVVKDLCHFIGPLIKAGAKIDKKSNDGRTPIHAAVQMNNPLAIKAFHTAGVDLSALVCETRKGTKVSPLYVAAALGKKFAILALYQIGISVDIYLLHFKMRIVRQAF